jgi:hypothetical protein
MKTKPQLAFLYMCCWFPCAIWAQGTPQQQPTNSPAPQKQPAPAPSASQESLTTGDGQLSVELSYWLTRGTPSLKGGAGDTNLLPGNLTYPGTSKATPGIVVSFPAGRENTLRISYFRTQGDGSTTETGNVDLFGTAYAPGDYLATRYKLQDAKVSWDYFSFPFPVDPSRFRLKTLWEVEYTSITTSIDAPLKTVAVDSTGAPISNTATGTRWFIYPSFGLAIEKALFQHFRVEGRASGFAFPHRSVVWDAEGSAVWRTGQFEVVAGVKAFHFKTSPQKDQYLFATLSGAYVGMRWYPKWW